MSATDLDRINRRSNDRNGLGAMLNAPGPPARRQRCGTELPFVLFVAGMRNLLTRVHPEKIAVGHERQ